MNITLRSYTLKVEYEGEIRKVPAISNYEELRSTVASLFGFNSGGQSGYIRFTYEDEDKELITISNDDDMQCMFDQFKDKTPKIWVEYNAPKFALNNIGLS